LVAVTSTLTSPIISAAPTRLAVRDASARSFHLSFTRWVHLDNSFLRQDQEQVLRPSESRSLLPSNERKAVRTSGNYTPVPRATLVHTGNPTPASSGSPLPVSLGTPITHLYITGSDRICDGIRVACKSYALVFEGFVALV
jgi:hypothetical protein